MRQTSRNGKNKQIKQQKKNKIQIIDTLYIFTANYVVFFVVSLSRNTFIHLKRNIKVKETHSFQIKTVSDISVNRSKID